VCQAGPKRPFKEFSGVDQDAVSVLDRIAHVFCVIAGRSAVGWKLYRDAAATDPEIAERLRGIGHVVLSGPRRELIM
jgi:hypothetical protein